jgi:hypothetical protein
LYPNCIDIRHLSSGADDIAQALAGQVLMHRKNQRFPADLLCDRERTGAVALPVLPGTRGEYRVRVTQLLFRNWVVPDTLCPQGK